MTKELAISLLSSKRVYLTLEGKQMLEFIIKEKRLRKENEKLENHIQNCCMDVSGVIPFRGYSI
jgi:hypothetical protein